MHSHLKTSLDVWKKYKTSTVQPLLADTSLIQTPLFHGQHNSQRNQNSYHLYLYNTDTEMQTLKSGPYMYVLN